MDRGKLVILCMFLVGLAAATFTVWFRYTSAKQAMRFWGVDATMVILNAPEVDLIQLGPPLTANELPTHPKLVNPRSGDLDSVRIGDQRLSLVARIDVSSDVELPRLRRKLVEDASFEWNAATDQRAGDTPYWNYALRFVDGDRTETLAFNLREQAITRGGDATRAKTRLTPLMRDELDLLVKEHVPRSN